MSKYLSDENEVQLHFFAEFPKDCIKIQGVPAALQSIETTFRLSALERWPTSIILIWHACELLLRANLGLNINDEGVTSYRLQKKFYDLGDVTESLNTNVTKLRRLRNEIAHDGYSPKDDIECIKSYFGVGLAYADVLFKTLCKESMESIGRKTEGNSWFWDVLKDTKKVIHKKFQSGRKLGDALLPMIIASRRINQLGGLVHKDYFYRDVYTSRLEECFQDLAFDIRAAVGAKFAEEISNICNSEILFIPEFDCFGPCASEGSNVMTSLKIGEILGENNYKVEGINVIGCIECQYIITDPDVLDTFVFSKLTKSQKELLGHFKFSTCYDNAYSHYKVNNDHPEVKSLIEDICREK
jgi:hypothetical protein